MQLPDPGWPPIAVATVAASLIAAAAALINTFVQHNKHRDIDEKLSELEAKRKEIALASATVDLRSKQVDKEASDLKERWEAIYGTTQASYQIGTWKTTLRLENDGTGTMIRESGGIVVPQNKDTLSIPFTAEVGQAVGLLPEPTVDRLSSSPVKPKWRLRRRTGSIIEGWIEFTGLSVHAGASLGFRVSQQLGKGFCTTEEEAAQAYKDSDFKTEYYSIAPLVPTEVLELSVELPTAFTDPYSQSRPAVFYGWSEEIFYGELNRLTAGKCFNVAGHTLTLKVQKPLRGHKYAIAWNPPSAADLARFLSSGNTSFGSSVPPQQV